MSGKVGARDAGGDEREMMFMAYQYLFCATCGQRRIGHSYRCSVCDSLLKRPATRKDERLLTLVRGTREAAQQTREPVARPIAA
jgi:hypothetical protein